MLPLKAQGKSLFHTSLLASVTAAIPWLVDCCCSVAQWCLTLCDPMGPKEGPFLLLLLIFCLTVRARTSSTIWIPLEYLCLVLGFRRNIFSVFIIRYDVSNRVFVFFFLNHVHQHTPVLYHLLEFAQTQVHWISNAIQTCGYIFPWYFFCVSPQSSFCQCLCAQISPFPAISFFLMV